MPQVVTADHIAAAGGAFEPQRKNNFTLIIPVGDSGVIQRSLNAFPLPKETNEPIAVQFGNEERKVAGRATYEPLELTLKDYVDTPIAQQLIQWRRLVYNPETGVIGLAKDYKKEGEVIMFGPNGDMERTWKLYGIWPSKLDPGGGDMNANEPNIITTTLAVDRAVEQF